MSALPSPRPRASRKSSRKQALLKQMARLIEEHMDEMGFSEAEKNVRVDAFVQDVRKLKASRGAIPSK